MGATCGIELKCGEEGINLARVERMHERAREIAERFGIESYFDTTYEEGDIEHTNGYIYPTTGKLLAVLDALDDAGVEYDNIDLPAVLDESRLLAELHRRYPVGVSINVAARNDIRFPVRQRASRQTSS